MDVRKAIGLLPTQDVNDYVVNTDFDFAKFRVGKVDFTKLSKDDKNEYVTSLVRSVLGDKGMAILHAGATHSTEKRQKFLAQLNAVVVKESNVSTNTTKPPEENTTSLLSLLNNNSTLLKLYQEALLEERDSIAFRNAVFTKALTLVEGAAALQSAYIIVGGPSASGKSYYAPSLLKEVFTSAMPQDNSKPDAGNYVVAIDGGIDRDLSQIRSLVLQVALNKGFAGIHDLQDLSEEIAIKKIIKAAALSNDKLSLIVPTTFTRVGAVKEIGAIHQDPATIGNRQLAYAEIQSKPDEPGSTANAESFKTYVLQSGVDRAYVSECKIDRNANYRMNKSAPCESKEYKPKNFERGKDKSHKAGAIYQSKFAKSGAIYIPIIAETNFRYKNDQNEWVVAPRDYKGKMTRVHPQDFERWQKVKVPDLEEWLKENKQTLTKPKIIPEIRGEKFLQGQLFELKQEFHKLLSEPRTNSNARTSGGRGSRSGSLPELLRRASSAGRNTPVEVASTNDAFAALLRKCDKFVERMEVNQQSHKAQLEALAAVDQLALEINSVAKTRGQNLDIRAVRENIGRHKDDIVNQILGHWTDKIADMVEQAQGNREKLVPELNKIANILQQYLPYVQDSDNFLQVYERLLVRIDSPDPAVSPRLRTPELHKEDSSESVFVIPGKEDTSTADDLSTDEDIVVMPKDWSLDLIISNLKDAKEFDLGLVRHCLECYRRAEGGDAQKQVALAAMKSHFDLLSSQHSAEISNIKNEIAVEREKFTPAKELNSTALMLNKFPSPPKRPLPPNPRQNIEQQPPQPPQQRPLSQEPIVAEQEPAAKPKPLPVPGPRRR